MPTAAADHLSCFCHMVRDSRIPMAEVHRIIKRYSKTKSELQKTFDKVLNSARQAASEISDPNLKANAMVVIAGFSGDEKDMAVAIEPFATTGIGLVEDGKDSERYLSEHRGAVSLYSL